MIRFLSFKNFSFLSAICLTCIVTLFAITIIGLQQIPKVKAEENYPNNSIEENTNSIEENSDTSNTEEITSASIFIEQLADNAITSLTKEDMDSKTRDEIFREILLEGFNVPTIARFVLGSNWRRSTAAQREEYLSLFEDMLVDTYAYRFAEYSGQHLEVVGERHIRSNDSKVSSRVISPNSSPVDVNWHVRQNDNGRYQVIDVEIAGVSMSLTQRSDFSSVIRRGGMEALLNHMREKLGESNLTTDEESGQSSANLLVETPVETLAE